MERLSPTARLSRRVAERSDAEADAGVVPRAKARALEGFRPGRARSVPRFAIAAAAAVALAAVVLAVWPRSRSSLTYAVGPERAAGAVGAWIAAEGATVPVSFSDGTVLSLAAGGRARVTHADADGASVLLERGAFHAKVVHASPTTRWSLSAGPFEVRVVGTEFDASWDPARETLEVAMAEGRVMVTGPLLGGGRPLAAGERLRVHMREQRMEVTAAGALAEADANGAAPGRPAQPDPGAPRADTAAEGAAEVGAGAAKGESGPKGAPREGAAPAASAASGAAAAEAAPGWRELQRNGKHREAMAAVDREGFAAVVASSSADDLLALADAARYSGDFRRAHDALLAARARGARGGAAFRLGKLAADHQGSPSEGLRWFKTYLSEEPGGSFAEQALGRVIELTRAGGDEAGARAAAETYLSRYPAGAFAPLARAAAGR